MKKVDKYQFYTNSSICEAGVETFTGINTETQQQHTIKKINLNQKQNNVYESVFDEIKIMKKIKHENLLYCYKVLQTSRNIYVIYDLYHHKTLGDVLQTQLNLLTDSEKIHYVKQIIQGLKALKAQDILHLDLNPHNIYITKGKQVKIGGFKYSTILSKDKSRISLNQTPPLSIFVPNQIKEYRIAFRNSDIYSLGKIIRTLNIDAFLDNKNLNVGQLIQKMIHTNPSARMTLSQVENALFGNQSISKVSPKQSMMKSKRSNYSTSRSTRISPFSPKQPMSPMSPKIPISPKASFGSLRLQDKKRNLLKQKSLQSQQQKKLTTKNSTQLSTIDQLPQETSKTAQKLKLQYLQTMKWRNLSIFLVELAGSCCKTTMIDLTAIEVACLLVKKGLNIITMLYQYIQKIQKSMLLDFSSDEKISQLQQIKKMKEIFKKEKQNHTVKYKSLKEILSEVKITDFEMETNNIDNSIKKKVEKMLKNDSITENLQKSDLINIYFLSQLLQYENSENMFEILTNKNVLNLHEQNFLIRLEKYTEQELIKLIKTKSTDKS